MLERFEGDGGRRRLVDALSRQSVVQGSSSMAEALADAAQLSEVASGAVLIEQGGADNDLFMILAGGFAILVNGRQVARRAAECHVGEMALINPKARRSATVVALEDSVVAKIGEAAFAKAADAQPTLWRHLASDVADRLHERNSLVRQRNEQSRVFVGSSRESLDVATGVQRGLAGEPIIVTVWTNGVFGPSDFPIEALERAAVDSDFAILVLGPDDRVLSRERENTAPRDNVILELGLFIGACGRHRVFFMVPEGMDVKIPTDILGVTPVSYSMDDGVDLGARLAEACETLRLAIQTRGPR